MEIHIRIPFPDTEANKMQFLPFLLDSEYVHPQKQQELFLRYICLLAYNLWEFLLIGELELRNSKDIDLYHNPEF